MLFVATTVSKLASSQRCRDDSTYKKSVSVINLINREKHKVIPLKVGTTQACPLSPHLFNIVLEVPARATRQQKEIKKDTNLKEKKINLPLFADDVIIHLSDPKNSTRELLQLINTLSNIAGYKINSKKSVALHYTDDKWAEKEIGETGEHACRKV